jgi:hypothetical protein
MIICHEKKLIFVKTKKVGGTSFEIALSKFCGPQCIITPVTPEDEKLRQSLGYRGAQNYVFKVPNREKDLELFNHIPAPTIKRLLPAWIWDSYKKVTIVRNPFEVMASKYFWRGVQMPFDEFILTLDTGVEENEVIAPLDGPAELDVYLRHEHLEADLIAHDLAFLVDGMKNIHAKGHTRPQTGDAADLFAKHPQIGSFVAEKCHKTIERFGYVVPGSAAKP